MYNVEIQTNNQDQYSRRNNIEINNIPEKVNYNLIEIYVLKVMASIGINLQSYDFVAVYRIGKYMQGKNRNVIVRFINRKNAFACLRNRKNLVNPLLKNIKSYTSLRTYVDQIKIYLNIYIN